VHYPVFCLGPGASDEFRGVAEVCRADGQRAQRRNDFQVYAIFVPLDVESDSLTDCHGRHDMQRDRRARGLPGRREIALSSFTIARMSGARVSATVVLIPFVFPWGTPGNRRPGVISG
jgi:hypothetical protein